MYNLTETVSSFEMFHIFPPSQCHLNLQLALLYIFFIVGDRTMTQHYFNLRHLNSRSQLWRIIFNHTTSDYFHIYKNPLVLIGWQHRHFQDHNLFSKKIAIFISALIVKHFSVWNTTKPFLSRHILDATVPIPIDVVCCGISNLFSYAV